MQNPLDYFLSDLANKIQTAKEYKDIIKDSQNVDVNKNVFEGFMLGVAETIKKELKDNLPETTQIEAVSSIGDQQKDPEPQEDPLAKFVTTLASTISASKNKPIEQETKDEDEEKKVEDTPVPAPEPQQDSFEKFIDNLKDIIQKNPKELPAPSLPIVDKKDKPKAGVKDYVKELVKKPKDENEEKPKSKSDLIKDLVRKFVEGEIKGFKDEISQKFNQVGAAYGGGGGTNAVQYANGGTMNGDLNVNGHILSGGKDISNYFGGSGGGSQTLSFNESNADLSISGGNTVSLSALSGGVSGPTDRLVNGSYQVVLSSDGTLFLPGSGTIANIASVAQIGFEINGLFNYAGQTSVGLNTFNAGLGNPAWGPAIQANPTDYEIIFNGGLVATITSAAGTASPGARWDFTGSWPANPTGAPVTIRAKNYTPGIQGTDGIRLAANNNSWTFGTDGSLSFPDNTTQTTAFTGNPDLTPYAKITDFVHLSGDTMTGDLYTPTLSAGNIYGSGLLKIGTGFDINVVGAYGLFTSPMGINAGFTIHRGDDSSYASLDFLENGLTSTGWSIQMQPSNSDLQFVDRVNNSNAFTIQAGGNVGINAGAPLAKLHVIGSSNDVNTPIAIIESAGSQAPYTFRVGGVDRAYVKGDNGGNLAFGAQNFIAFEAGGFGGAAEAMRITEGKNIGIGTTEPAEKLEVVGNLKVRNGNAGLNFNQGTGDSAIIDFYKSTIFNGGARFEFGVAGNPDIQFWNFENGFFRIGTDNTERFRITSDGNVGIGTTTPAEKLEVNGNIKATGGDSTQWNSNYTTVSENSAYWADTRGDVTFGQNVTINGNLTALGSSIFRNTIFTTTSALSVVNNGPGPALYVSQSPGNFDVASFYDQDGIEVLHIGNAPTPGTLAKVGINESYPGAELTVNGAISSNSSISVVSMQVANNAGIGAYAPLYFNLDVNGPAGDGSIGSSYGNLSLGASSDIVINPNNNLLLGPAGNVGIGTTTPAEKLTVNGAISSNSTITAKGGNSNDWNSNYTTTNANSSKWSEAYTNLTSNSAAYLSAVDISLLAATSGSWNSVYTTVNTNSATTWNYQGTDIKNLTAGWVGGNSAYTTTNSNSAFWANAYTNLVTNSAAYLLSGTDVNLGQIPVLSANWNNTYNVFSANSGKYENSYTNLENNSATYLGTTRQFDIVQVGLNSYSYCGFAVPGTSTASTGWTIKRLFFSTAGTLLSSGTVTNSVWNSRYSYNY